MLAGILSPFKDLTPHSLVYFGGLIYNTKFPQRKMYENIKWYFLGKNNNAQNHEL